MSGAHKISVAVYVKRMKSNWGDFLATSSPAAFQVQWQLKNCDGYGFSKRTNGERPIPNYRYIIDEAPRSLGFFFPLKLWLIKP